MSLSQITCRLLVACDISMRRPRGATDVGVREDYELCDGASPSALERCAISAVTGGWRLLGDISRGAQIGQLCVSGRPDLPARALVCSRDTGPCDGSRAPMSGYLRSCMVVGVRMLRAPRLQGRGAARPQRWVMEVLGLWRHAVKSLQGERLESARFEDDGLVGDRRWGIRDLRTGRILTARRRPELLGALASYDGELPMITLPN